MDLESCNNTFDVARGCNSAPLATISQTEIKASFAISIEKKPSLPSLNDVETWLNAALESSITIRQKETVSSYTTASSSTVLIADFSFAKNSA